MKKLIILFVMIFLFINFFFFWLSIWPYSKPVTISGGEFITNMVAIKTNFVIYMVISIITMLIGIICYIRSKKKVTRTA